MKIFKVWHAWFYADIGFVPWKDSRHCSQPPSKAWSTSAKQWRQKWVQSHWCLKYINPKLRVSVDVTYEPLIIIRVKLTESCQIRLALGSVQLMGLLWLASYSGFDYESRNLPCFKSHYLSLFSSKHQCTRRLSTRREASTGIRFLNVIGALSGRPMKMIWYTMTMAGIR